MNKIKILRNFPISLDGINVQTWQAGSERDVDDATLALLIGQGACEIVTRPCMPRLKIKRESGAGNEIQSKIRFCIGIGGQPSRITGRHESVFAR